MATKIYLETLKDIIKETILSNRIVRAVALMAIIFTLISAYFLVLASNYITILITTFKTERFYDILEFFAILSIIAMIIKFIPKIIVTAILQNILRNQFVKSLRFYLKMDYISFHKRTPGEIRYTIFMKAYSVPLCVQMIVFEVSTLFGTIIFSLYKILQEASFTALCVFALIPAIYLGSIYRVVDIKTRYQMALLEEQRKTSSKLYDELLNYEIIKAFNLEREKRIEFYNYQENQTKSQIDLNKFDSKAWFFLNFIFLVPYIILIYVGLILSPDFKGSSLFQITILYIAVTSQLKRMGSQYSFLIMYLNQILFMESGCDQMRIASDVITDFKDKIEFKDVTIYYKDQAIINNINAVINKGQKIAVVGKNGTGKSTFIKTLLGFTNYTGDILIDGKNVRDLSNKSILKLISYIPQDDYTSDDTVLENLMRGNPNATREEIEEKARIFDAHDYFMSLEKGYDTHVGPRGNKLSGGQKQKLSIVRAAVKDGDIFILDEATASMDKQYEKKIIPQMINNLSMKTVIMIVHGKDYLRFFDNIFFFNEGRLEAFGKYDDLKRTSENFELYAK